MIEFKSKLLEALLDDDINKIIQIIYQELNCHFNITDEYYRLKVQIPAEPIHDLIWDTYLTNASLPPHIIKLLNEDQLLEKGYSSDKPYIVNSPTLGELPRVTLGIKNDQKIYGYLTVYYIDKIITDEDLNKIEIASQVLAYYYSKKEKNISSIQNVYELFINQLFLGQIKNEEDLCLWQNSLPIPINPKYQIVCATFGQKSNFVFLKKIYNEIKTYFNYEKCTLVDDRLYFIFDHIDHQASQTLLMNIVSFLQKYDLKIGISNSYYQLIQTRNYCKQAEIASSLCKPKQYLYFSNCYLEAISTFIHEKNIYIHPSFVILKEYDKRNKTEYFNTLLSYLHHFGRHNEIEAELKVHRNTIRNRLNFIENLCEISLDDAYTFTSLYMSYIIYSNCA